MSRATELADELVKVHGHRLALDSATLLRQQDEMLRQCVDAMEILTVGSAPDSWPRLKAALAAAKECLK